MDPLCCLFSHLSLLCCVVFSLQSSDNLLRKGWPLGSLVCDIFLCFCHFPIWCLESSLVLDYISIPDLCLLLYFVILMKGVYFKTRNYVQDIYIYLNWITYLKHIINKTSEINNIHNIMTIKGMIKDLIKYCIYPRYSQYHHYQRHDKKVIMTIKSMVKCISWLSTAW